MLFIEHHARKEQHKPICWSAAMKVNMLITTKTSIYCFGCWYVVNQHGHAGWPAKSTTDQHISAYKQHKSAKISIISSLDHHAIHTGLCCFFFSFENICNAGRYWNAWILWKCAYACCSTLFSLIILILMHKFYLFIWLESSSG